MRILVTADLHCPMAGLNPDVYRKWIKQAIEKENPEVIILAGDLGETRIRLKHLEDVLQITKSVAHDKCVAALLGNHDLWLASNKADRIKADKAWTDISLVDSMALWNTIPSLFEKNGVHYLEHKNIVIDKLAIVGSYLHYDFSARDMSLALPPEYYISNKASIINDGVYISGIESDIEFAKTIGLSFKERLKEAQHDDNITEIVVITHVPCMECQMVRRPSDFNWSRANAFFGNFSHQDLIMSCSKIRFVISGHTHVGKLSVIDRSRHGMSSITAITLDGDYGYPRYRMCETGNHAPG